MAKLTLADLTSIQNDPGAVNTINDNSALIETAFENTLSRDGTSPNTMGANLDMNSHRILNLPRPLNPNEPVRVRDVVNTGGSGVGVPPGGATDQALTKTSNTSYDFDWHDVVNSFEGRTGHVVSQTGDYTKAEVGLGNVDNTSDLNKPISTATQTALNGKQPLDATLTTLSGKSTTGSGNIVLATSPNITTPTGIVKGDVGLGNVDNTSDVNKPISSATQTALNNKQPLNATLTGLSGKSTTGTGSIVLATNPVFDGYITVNEQANTIGLGLTAPAGTPTPNKYIRVNSVGDLDVVDSSFSNQILVLTNAGYLSVKDKLSVAKGTDTNSVLFTGAPSYPGAISIWSNANRMILSGGSSGFQFTDNTAGVPLLNISNSGNLTMAGAGTTLTMTGASSGTTVLTPPSTGGGTVTFFQGSDTVVGRNTTDTLTNKTLSSPVFSGTASGSGTIPFAQISSLPTTVSGYGITDAVTLTGTQNISGKTFVTNAVTVTGTTPPTFSNGVAAVYASSTNGLILRGQGSTNDITFLGATGGTAFTLPSGTSNISFPNAIQVGVINNSSNTVNLVNRVGTDTKLGNNNVVIADAGTVTIMQTTATPAGGSTNVRLVFGSTAGFGIYIGSGVPTVSAAQGSLYLRSDGSSTSTRLYVNTNGSTTWTNFTSAI